MGDRRWLSLRSRCRKNILDAGCGRGFYSEMIVKSGGNPFGVDVSFNMIRECTNKNIKCMVADVENLPFTFKFDKILCAGALEFVRHPDKTLKEFNRVLKDNGIFVLLYPRLGFFGLLYFFYHRLHGINITLFTKDTLNRLMINNGFEVLSNDNANILSSVLVAIKHNS